MGNFIKNTLFILPLLLPMFLPTQVHAQEVGSLQDLLIEFGEFIWGATGLVRLLFFLAFLYFLWGAVIFILNSGENTILSEGKEVKRSEGKKKMLWGIITLTIIFSIWGIIAILQEVVGVSNLP